MGLCLAICADDDFEQRQFRQVPFPNGGRDRDHVPPTFHHPHFRQVAAYNDKNYEQNEPYDPRSPYGSKQISGESTRISGTHYQNGGSSSSIRREPGQIPREYHGNAPIDMERTEVYRQGNETQTKILKTPRGNTQRGGTPRTGGRNANASGRRTPTANDPFADPNQQDDGSSCYDDDDEMILICADCYCDVMDENCPKRCQVSGRMHV